MGIVADDSSDSYARSDDHVVGEAGEIPENERCASSDRWQDAEACLSRCAPIG